MPFTAATLTSGGIAVGDALAIAGRTTVGVAAAAVAEGSAVGVSGDCAGSVGETARGLHAANKSTRIRREAR